MGRNEVLFREVNERIEEIQTGEGAARRFDFLCECADRDCIERLSLSLAEYEDIRSESTDFVVLPGHDAPHVELVIQRATASRSYANRTKPRNSPTDTTRARRCRRTKGFLGARRAR